jgi:hypothetical protein
MGGVRARFTPEVDFGITVAAGSAGHRDGLLLGLVGGFVGGDGRRIVRPAAVVRGRVAKLVEIRGRRNLRVIDDHPTGGWHRHGRSRHGPDYRHRHDGATCM